jgi:predicted permease
MLPGLRTLRNLVKHRRFTLSAVAMLALGIGINAAVFTVTNGTLFKGFPLVNDNGRIAYMTTGVNCCVSYPDFIDWRAEAQSFDGIEIVHGLRITLMDGSGFPETYDATEVSSGTFKLVGVEPVLGRDFSSSDDTAGAARTAILRYGFWQRRYGGDPSVIGRTVRINGLPTAIIGVMPDGFSFPQNQDLWTAFIPTPEVMQRDNRNTWFAFGRMKEGVTLETARAEMETIGRRLGAAYPLTNEGRNALPRVVDFEAFFIGPNAALVYEAMMGAVAFVLLIACANLAVLTLVRAVGRSREISLRIALGAGRWRIIRQLLIESMALSSLGGFFGWLLAAWGVRLYARFASGSVISDATPGTWFDQVLNYSMDYRVFAYLVAVSIGTGVLFGLAPGIVLARLDVNTILKDVARGPTVGGKRQGIFALLVAGEMALAIVLLAGAGVMIRSFLNVYDADVGLKPDRILTGLIALPVAKYANPASRISFYDELGARLKGIAGVDSVSITDGIPGDGARHVPFEVEGEVATPSQNLPDVSAVVIGEAYFQTLGRPLLSGREFADSDDASTLRVAIVNERFAEQQWPGQNAVGKRLRLVQKSGPDAWLVVVGVAPNVRQSSAVGRESDPVIYMPHRQQPNRDMWVMARTGVQPAAVATEFRREVQAIDSALPVALGPFPLAERMAGGYQYRGVVSLLFLVFAATAVLLAAIGLYAVIAFAVSRRTQEIGIRIAIGASARDIRRLVFRQGALPLCAGLIAGLTAAAAVNRLLESQLVQVSPADPATLAAATAVLAIAAALGCWLPVRTAMRVDPLTALRHE